MNGQPIQLRPVEIEVISTPTAEEMQSRINHRLKEGWLFHGDLKVVYVPDTGASPLSFVQAMVRVEAVPVPMPRGGGSNILVPQ